MGMKDGDCLFIRPERVVLKGTPSDEAADGFRLTGSVLNISFLGHLVRYQVAINENIKVYADCTNLSDMPVFSVGDRVAVGWNKPDDIRVSSEERRVGKGWGRQGRYR